MAIIYFQLINLIILSTKQHPEVKKYAKSLALFQKYSGSQKNEELYMELSPSLRATLVFTGISFLDIRRYFVSSYKMAIPTKMAVRIGEKLVADVFQAVSESEQLINDTQTN